MSNHINCGDAFDLMHGEERRMEIADVKAAKRNERIGVLTKEYFEDVGTFFEWIQGIEVDPYETGYFENMHLNLIKDDVINNEIFSARSRILFHKYCEELAIEEIGG